MRRKRAGVYVRIKSRVDQWGHLLMAVLFADFLMMLFLSKGERTVYFFCALFLFALLLWLVPIYLRTDFIFEDNELLIRSGLFYRRRISYSVITKAKKTTEMSVSRAFSFFRIEFEWWENGKRKRILIAPEDRDLFQRLLFLKNPLIDIGDNQPRAFHTQNQFYNPFDFGGNSRKIPNQYREKTGKN